MDPQNEPQMTPLRTFTSKFSTGQLSPSDRLRSPILCSYSKATERARLLVGCYRKGEAEDSDIYVAALVTILCSYPEGVVLSVTDPRTGVPGDSKWLPTIADVRHACEIQMKPIRDEAERNRRRQESEHILQQQDADRSKRKTFAELAALYPDIVGTTVKRAPTEAEKAAALAGLEARRGYLQSPLAPSDRLSPSNKAHQRGLDATTDGDAA